jgi:uncharacterized membrane protein YhaH (DUF805 family)
VAYRSVVEEIPGNLRRTVLGTFDFRGRSTRTELLVFMFVPQLFLGLVLIALDALFLDLDFDAKRQVQNGVTLLLTVPVFALFVRRLHDQERTGWWVVLLLGALVFAVMSDNGHPDIRGISKFETPFWLDLMFVGAIVAVWVLSLWPPSQEGNRYGPNPRLDLAELRA